MSDTDKIIEQVLAEAERIRSSDKLDPRSATPTADGGSPAGEGAPPVAPSPLADCSALANLCVILGDVACTKVFGPAGALQEPLRTEAVKAWGAVLEQYIPLLEQAGPWGALLGVYAVHLVLCAMVTTWTPAQSPASSADAEAARPPS